MERRLISLHIPSLRKLLGCINKELYEKKESVANHEGWRFMAIYVKPPARSTLCALFFRPCWPWSSLRGHSFRNPKKKKKLNNLFPSLLVVVPTQHP